MRLALTDEFPHISRGPPQQKISQRLHLTLPVYSREGLEMAIVTSQAKTASGSKYLQQLCKHWGHKFEVEFSETRGQVRFPSALVTMEASADALLVSIETDEAESVERLKEIVANHLDRFAFREAPLPFEWSEIEDR
jgi:uncharacterized protein